MKRLSASVASIGSGLLLAACGPQLVERELAALSGIVVVTHASPSEAPAFEADLFYGSSTYPNQECAHLHATATLNGMDVPVTEAGSLAPSPTPFLLACQFPRFELPDWSSAPPGADGVSTLVIADASRAVTFAIRNLGAERALTLVSPANGAVFAGTRVSIAWSPPTDVLDPATTAVSLNRGGELANLSGTQLTIEGATVAFDMPALPAGAITAFILAPGAPTATCDGASLCRNYLRIDGVTLQVQ